MSNPTCHGKVQCDDIDQEGVYNTEGLHILLMIQIFVPYHDANSIPNCIIIY